MIIILSDLSTTNLQSQSCFNVTMLFSTIVTFIFLTARTASADCGWQLAANDCICMNSTNGALLADETTVCCRDMGQNVGASRVSKPFERSFLTLLLFSL